MNNYLDYDQINDYEENNLNKKKINIKYLIIAFFFLIIIVLFLIIYKNNSQVNYSEYENKLINALKNYITNNNILTYNEGYLDTTTLKVDLPNNCSLKSGVIYNNDEYNAYLLCSDYESNIFNNDNNDVKLIGNNVEFVMLGNDYYDPGYVGENVKVNGFVEKKEGVYTLYYIPTNGSAILRKVVVTNSTTLSNYFPYITLNGDSVETVKLGNEYKDKGAIATDLFDGVITNEIIKHGNVDVNKIGEYDIYYSVTNKNGYTSSILRKVIVEDNKKDLHIVHELSTTEKTGDEVEITLNIIGKDYYYTLLPSGFENEERILSYTDNENGTYTFEIHDNEDNIINYDVVISNINNAKPTGTCKVYLYNDRTTIEANGKSENGILGYNYFINGAGTGYTIKNTYTINVVNPTIAYVKILDTLKNEGVAFCTIEDKRSYVDPNGITRTVSGSRLTIPISSALEKKGYTINDLNSCIYERVQKAGPGTRYGVMAAAAGLIECTKAKTGYVIAYDHDGGKVEGNYCSSNSDICGKLGVNSRWGKVGGTCERDQCYYGLNCANFVHWAFCNGGMDMCTKGSAGAPSLATTKYFPGATIIKVFRNKATYVAGEDLTQKYNAAQILAMVKPGDVLYREYYLDPNGKSKHIVVVVGKDEKYLYIAENGDKIKKSTYSYSDILTGDYSYMLLLLDNYYANKNNLNNLYN